MPAVSCFLRPILLSSTPCVFVCISSNTYGGTLATYIKLITAEFFFGGQIKNQIRNKDKINNNTRGARGGSVQYQDCERMKNSGELGEKRGFFFDQDKNALSRDRVLSRNSKKKKKNEHTK